MIEDKIARLVEEKFTAEGWEDCFLVEIKVHGSHKLDVFIDSDEGITFKTCQQVSRHLEAVLDEELWLGEKYTLEVSSPGVSRPLKLKRQYPKNIGRKLEVKQKEGGKEEGKLVAVQEDRIVLEKRVKIKEGKKKRNELVAIEIPFDEIVQTKVKISFK
ncbi:MAG: ribosome assembly cofactor RimP [Bacteroidota bacterium]